MTPNNGEHVADAIELLHAWFADGERHELTSEEMLAAFEAVGKEHPPVFDDLVSRLTAGQRDVLRRRLYERAKAAPAESRPPARFRFVTVAELLRRPPTAWRVLRVIPARGLVVLWGASGSGKTFVALDVAAAIARGVAWAGRRTRRAAVAYVAAEGQLRDRIDAYLQHRELAEDDLANLRVLDSSVNLLEPAADIPALIAALHEFSREVGLLGLVIIDTLNRAMPGGDENSSEDMGMIVAAAQMIEREFECAVLFVHHSGKDESKGSRGHSSLKAATDAEISVRRDGDVRTVTAEKVRDGEDGDVLLTFRLGVVDLGAMREVDPDAGETERRTSCYVDPTDAPAAAEPNAKLTDTDQIALRTLREMRAGRPADVAVTLDEWRDRFRVVRGIDRADPKAMESSKKAFQRALDKLVQRRFVEVTDVGVRLW